MRGRVALVRVLVVVILAVGAVVAAAPAANAAGPTSLGVSGWQVYSNTNTYANPLYSGSCLYYIFGFCYQTPTYYHGDPGEYAAAPAIPAENDSGWADCGANSPFRTSPYGSGHLCPNSSTIGMAVGSILTSPCFADLNFTYFQALVSIPSGTTISQFSVNMSGADDGARISLVNSDYPGGVTPSNGYIWQNTGQTTGNLASYVKPGEVNRVVITQVDDCATGNNLNSAQISLNGTVIQPDSTAPTASPTVSPAPNGNGWNNTDATVNWHWTDTGGSGIDTSNCTTSSSTSGEGTQTLTATCSDLAGNQGHASQVVKVDKTAPTVSVPSPISVETSSAGGTTVSYFTSASDNLDPSPSVSCSPASGSNFGLGLTTVSCTATDQAGNSSSKSFTVAVSNPVPAPGQANGVASHVSTGQEQIATASTIDTSSPDFTGQPWFAPVAAQSGAGLAGAYGRFPGTDWLSQYDYGKSINPHWSRFRASFDAPNGGMTLKLLVDNAVTGVWVNGHAVGTCARDSASQCPPHDGGYALPGVAIPIPDGDLQPTGNVIVIEVLDYELGLSTGGIDFEVVPQPPTVTPDVSGTQGSNGWYTSDVSVHWNVVGADSTSAGCADQSVTTDTSGTTFTCTATNTGGSTSKSVTVKRDATKPSITASAFDANANPYASGTWTNGNVLVHFGCTDAGSGVASVDPDVTVSAEGAGQSASGSCTDNAGNSASATVDQIQIDKTAPAANPVAETSPNANGWYNHDATVDWNWSDGTSGIDPSSCTTSSTSAGQGTITLQATCTDNAGNTGTSSYTVSVDKTKPSAAPVATPAANGAGWNNSDVTVAWNWTDAGGSGIDPSNCTTSSTSAGEGSGIVLSASCTDLAGNTDTESYTVNVDKTAPTDAPVVTPPNAAGWNNTDVSVAWNWTDSGGSGIDSNNCTQSSISSGEGTITLTSTCEDVAGNSSADSITVKVDKTAPSLAPSVSPNPVGLDYSAVASPNASDSGSGIASASCDPVDTSALGSFTVSCTATDNAGNTATATASYDVTGMATKQAVLDGINAVLPTATKHDADKLREAAKKLTDALDPKLWADPSDPAAKDGKKVFQDEKEAVQKFQELLRDKNSQIADATLQGWSNSLVTLDRAMAERAISAAAGADSHKLADAAKEIAHGDEDAAKGHLDDAIEHYGNAWQHVQEALKH